MSDFSNYDLRSWLDRVLSRHPRKSKERKSELRNTASALTRVVFPAAAAAALFVSAGQELPVSVSNVSGPPERAVYWLGSTPDHSSESSLIAHFESRAAAVTQQLRAGKLADVPAATLELARAVLLRTQAQPAEWISRVARNVVGLND